MTDEQFEGVTGMFHGLQATLAVLLSELAQRSDVPEFEVARMGARIRETIEPSVDISARTYRAASDIVDDIVNGALYLASPERER